MNAFRLGMKRLHHRTLGNSAVYRNREQHHDYVVLAHLKPTTVMRNPRTPSRMTAGKLFLDFGQ